MNKDVTVGNMSGREIAVFRISAFFSYFIGYIYLKYTIFSYDIGFKNRGFAIAGFAILFIIWTEVFAYSAGFSYKKLKESSNSIVEPLIYIACILLQSFSIAIQGAHSDWKIYQFLFWHFTIIYYVLARTGSFAAGKSGLFFLFDSFQGLFTIPLSNIFFRTISIFKKQEKKKDQKKDSVIISRIKNISVRTVVILFISVLIAFLVCAYAFMQLANTSSTFEHLGNMFAFDIDRITGIFIMYLGRNFFREFRDNLMWFIASVPISCWLFGLVGGGLRNRKPLCSDKEIEEKMQPLHQLPKLSAYIIIISVCLIYALFFATTVYDFTNHKGLFAETAHEASVRAVGSFWSLIKVVLLNFLIVAGSCFFSKKSLWDEKTTRILATVLFIFAFAFAMLAAYNLCGVYIALYGFTPRRILSSWVVFNVIIWCVLLMIRFYKKIPSSQYGIILAAVSFSVVVCGRF